MFIPPMESVIRATGLSRNEITAQLGASVIRRRQARTITPIEIIGPEGAYTLDLKPDSHHALEVLYDHLNRT